MDRRTSMKWMLAAASLPSLVHPAWATENVRAPAASGIGTDPDLVKVYKHGELWPLTLNEAERACAAALCALIIPADARSKSAADLNVHVFIDEWISAPYPRHVEDRARVRALLEWLDAEAGKRFGKPFAALAPARQRAICDAICHPPRARPELADTARRFSRFRDLTADGFYTTPEGMKDLGYTGNVPKPEFAGPPPAALKKAGVT